MSALLELCAFARAGRRPAPSSEAAAAALVAEAHAQGLAPLLDQALGEQRHGWPGELREAHRAAAYRGEQQQELLGRARGLLLDARIRSLPMKGAALVGCAYDAPADRPMDDVDLLALERFADAAAALQRAGFLVLEQADHAWALRDPATGAVLELHRGLVTCPEMFPFDADGLWSRRVAGATGERPSSEDLLVQLALHAAFQHGLRLKLVQFLDFRRLLERQPPEPARLAELAAVSRAEGSLLAALEAAALVVGVDAERLLAPLRRKAPSALLRRLERLRRAPAAELLAPGSAREIAGWRLLLVGRRRLQLLARTLAPAGARRGGVIGRGLRLARRLRRSV